MEPTTHTTNQTSRETQQYLKALFGSARSLVACDAPRTTSNDITCRPETTNGSRSPFIVTLSPSNGCMEFNIKSSGIALWKMKAITEEVAKIFGAPAYEAADEDNRTTPIGNENHLAYVIARYTNGVRIYWTSVSGINLHCPNRAIFNQLADQLAPKSPGHSI